MTYIANSGTQACRPTPARFSLLSFVRERTALLRQRRALKTLDARALEDIGISRDAAQEESNRSIWDAPDSWKC